MWHVRRARNGLLEQEKVCTRYYELYACVKVMSIVWCAFMSVPVVLEPAIITRVDVLAAELSSSLAAAARRISRLLAPPSLQDHIEITGAQVCVREFRRSSLIASSVQLPGCLPFAAGRVLQLS
jgi:hypothetical protein